MHTCINQEIRPSDICFGTFLCQRSVPLPARDRVKFYLFVDWVLCIFSVRSTVVLLVMDWIIVFFVFNAVVYTTSRVISRYFVLTFTPLNVYCRFPVLPLIWGRPWNSPEFLNTESLIELFFIWKCEEGFEKFRILLKSQSDVRCFGACDWLLFSFTIVTLWRICYDFMIILWFFENQAPRDLELAI